MNNFKNKGVTFVKTKNETFFSNRNKPFAEYEIWRLNDFCKTVLKDGAKELAEEIKQRVDNCERGYKGEQSVQKKLKYCGLDMYVLYCLYFDFSVNEYMINAQIDFLLITPKNIYILECKNWKNDIGIDKYQNFYLLYQSEPSKRIASPFEQLGRQIETIRKLVIKQGGTFWQKAVIRHIFKKNCKPVLVLVNDKERLYMEDDNVKTEKPIVHLDHLVDYIRNTEKRTRNGILYFIKRKILYSLVDFFVEKCVKMEVDLGYYENKLKSFKEK